jgi:hypothetical protein
MSNKTYKLVVKNRSFSRYFYAGVNSFLEEVFLAFDRDLLKKHISKRLSKEINKGCLTVSGYRQHDNIVYPFSYMVLIDNISEKSVYVKIAYAEGVIEDSSETAFEIPFEELSVEKVLSTLKEKYF